MATIKFRMKGIITPVNNTITLTETNKPINLNITTSGKKNFFSMSCMQHNKINMNSLMPNKRNGGKSGG